MKKTAPPAHKARPAAPASPEIEINPDFARALDLLENTDENVFITGKAGTGKSTLLTWFREHTKKAVVVLAPTGVAALNVQGQTIHSFFRFPPHITIQEIKKQRINKKLDEILKRVHAIVIDEVSMVRADLMDGIDATLRRYRKINEPFGGLQMIFIGDLYQLPPVVAGAEEREMFKTRYKSPYFFDADVFQACRMDFIELEKIYRQSDESFIRLLNKIRNNSVEEEDIAELNARHEPDFKEEEEDDFWITLTPANAAADAINTKRLARLETPLKTYEGWVEGEFSDKHLPTSLVLEVKIGAQIMMVNNDSGGRWVNGSVGKVIAIERNRDTGEDEINVELQSGKRAKVGHNTWEITRYNFNTKKGQLEVESTGSFTQYPFRLAWAVTIHKSQGKTFDRVLLDIGSGTFANGQIYVAVSRCTSFEGLILRKPLKKHHIRIDYNIIRFLTRFQYDRAEESMSLQDKIALIETAIAEERPLAITYLRPNDTKSRRIIEPEFIGQMEYAGKAFLGVEAFCQKRQDTRCFRVDRMLEISAEALPAKAEKAKKTSG